MIYSNADATNYLGSFDGADNLSSVSTHDLQEGVDDATNLVDTAIFSHSHCNK
jgi:hypothetical protein